MIKKILIICLLLQTINFLYGENPKIVFYDNYSIEFVNQINEFRNMSFVDKVFSAGFDWGDIFDLNIPLVDCYNCTDFVLDENLMEYAKKRVAEIINNQDISHKYLGDRLNGEGIFVMAFQNYIDMDYVIKIFLKNIFRTAVQRNSKETVFMYYPYSLIGVAIATASIEFEGIKYNIVILVVETALEEENSEDFYGRILSSEVVCENCNIEVKDMDGNKIGEFSTFLDGSFFIKGLPENFYLLYNDKRIFVELKNYNKNIEF